MIQYSERIKIYNAGECSDTVNIYSPVAECSDTVHNVIKGNDTVLQLYSVVIHCSDTVQCYSTVIH